jgi:hypothetical protein
VRETVKSLKIKKFASHQIKFDEIPETNPKKVFQDPAELNMSGKKLLLLFVCWNIIRNVSRDLSLRINEKGGTLGPVCVCAYYGRVAMVTPSFWNHPKGEIDEGEEGSTHTSDAEKSHASAASRQTN